MDIVVIAVYGKVWEMRVAGSVSDDLTGGDVLDV